MQTKFTKLKDEKLSPAQSKVNSTNCVIKNSQIKVGTPQIIKSDKHSRESNNLTFKPVIDNDLLIGLKVVCSCGEKGQVDFIYDAEKDI